MPAGRHLYFAYGSNLCVKQMALRCPDAVDPRPAVLSGHDWLINQRGVATVEPLAGTQVHGVLWRVSEADLATLDGAEGVPVRYRRDRLVVLTDDGPSPAWVYIDHRVTPGPPRPGYLPRIIDAAIHHRLPPRWIDFLRRWDPARWPRLRAPLSSAGPAPQSLSVLLGQPGVTEVSRLRSRFGFLAIHGGGLEEMTDVIAERAAEAAGASVYVVRHPDRYPHHLPSALFDPAESPRLADIPRPRRRRGIPARLWPHRPRHAVAGRRRQPCTGRSPRAPHPRARLPGRHRPRRHPSRTARAAPAESGQPGPRRRGAAGAAGSGQGPEPKESAAGGRRPVIGHQRPGPGLGGRGALLVTARRLGTVLIS